MEGVLGYNGCLRSKWGVGGIMGCFGVWVFGVKRGVGGIMGCLACFGANRCVGGERWCWGIMGCLGCFQVLESERGVWGHKGVSMK